MPNLPQAETHYPRARAAQLADVSLEFLERCEVARLVEVRVVQGREPQYSVQDVRQLALIGRLYQILGVDFQDLEIVLHLRSQLLDLQQQMEEMERQRMEREEQLLRELVDLRRRLADQAEWR
jgi:DNA-binding transcriptional MerR regulator